MQVYAEKIIEYRLDPDSLMGSPTLGLSPSLSPDQSALANTAPSPGLSSEFVAAVDSLWHDPIIPSILDRSGEFYLMDSAS